VTKSSTRATAQKLVPKTDSLLTDALHLNVPIESVVQLVRERHQILQPSDQP
jgi:hypothetical protein